MIVRYNHNNETILELSRTAKHARCICLLEHVLDIREMRLEYKTLIGHGVNKTEIPGHFDKDWAELGYSPVRWALKKLTGYLPLTERAKRSLAMLVLSIFTNENGTEIKKFDELEAAVQASPAGAEVVCIQDKELFALSNTDLCRLHNALVPEDKHVKKFATKADAVKRFKAVAEEFAASLPDTSSDEKKAAKAAAKAEKDAAKVAAKEVKAATGTRPRHTGNVYEAIGERRPFRPGTGLAKLVELCEAGTDITTAAAAIGTSEENTEYRIRRKLPENGYGVEKQEDGTYRLIPVVVNEEAPLPPAEQPVDIGA